MSPRPGALRVFGASLVAPGAGQWLLGSRRTYLYLGLELLGWAGYLERRSSALRQRDRYRDLAWEVARDRSGPRIGGGFAYYEAIARFPASGAWDADPDRPGLQPETDPSTYNGAVWQLARQLHLGGGETPDPSTPGYEAALAYYRERGYRPELSWDWTDEPRAARRYRSLVESSDERFRTATLVLGGIVANHLLSAVDAYVTVRAAPEIRRIVPGRSGRDLFGRWSLRIRLPARP